MFFKISVLVHFFFLSKQGFQPVHLSIESDIFTLMVILFWSFMFTFNFKIIIYSKSLALMLSLCFIAPVSNYWYFKAENIK